jgi:dihydroorotate dehydrogenase
MYRLFRALFFKLDPEAAHNLTLQLMRIGGISPINLILQMLYSVPAKSIQAFGLTFKNPVGLAAGYDKDGLAVRGLSALGFGHIEVGTITPRPQPGNPKPRVFRLVDDEAVINRMGFPSHGSVTVANSLKKLGHCNYPHQETKRVIDLRQFFPEIKIKQKKKSLILGVNIGKNKTTPNQEAVLDYLSLLQFFVPCADYLTINISSPNTEGLRDLQARDVLEELLTQLDYQRNLEQKKLRKKLPLLVKLAPDLTDDELDDALGVILDTGMNGVIATNTTVARPELRSKQREETGGLSGSPLRVRSEAMLKKIVRRVDGRVPIVSVGGIMSPEDAKRRLDMGATLVQVYTGLIYRGPGLVKEIVSGL